MTLIRSGAAPPATLQLSPLSSLHTCAGPRRVHLIGANLRPAANQGRPQRPIGERRQETLLGSRRPYLFMKKLQWCIIIVIDLLFGRYWQRKITSSAENCFTINFLSLRDVFSQFDWNKKEQNFSLRLFISVNSWHTFQIYHWHSTACPLYPPSPTYHTTGDRWLGQLSYERELISNKRCCSSHSKTWLTNKVREGRREGEIRWQNNKMVNLRWVRWVSSIIISRQ